MNNGLFPVLSGRRSGESSLNKSRGAVMLGSMNKESVNRSGRKGGKMP